MVLLLFLFLGVVQADLLLDFYLENTNKSSDPCENFYRHACPVGTPDEKMIARRFEKHMLNFSNPAVKSLFSKFKSSIFKDFDNLHSVLQNKSAAKVIPEQFSHWCLNGDKKKTEYFIHSFFGKESGIEGLNCTEAAKNISDQIEKEANFEDSNLLDKFLLVHKTALFDVFDDVSAKSKIIPQIFESMRYLSLDLLKETPWAQSHDVIREIREALIEADIHIFYEGGQEIAEMMRNLDQDFSSCNENLNSSTYELKLICLSYALLKNPAEELGSRYDDAYNGWNGVLRLGPLFYFVEIDDTNPASKLGYLGYLIGHEFSHTLFEGIQRQYYSYFSEEARECVLEQYNSTCNYFKEINCFVKESHLEEIGADILGQQLGYEIFKKRMGDRLNEKLEGYNVTNHQLYFYAFVPQMCQGDLTGEYDYGSHATENVRTNSIAQIPGFQEAFNCAADSKMVKSKTEQCHIYGPSAPNTK